MALFSKIKRAFGFGSDEYAEDLYDQYPSAEVTPVASDSTPGDLEANHISLPDCQNVEVELDSTPPDEIFQSVVELFNRQLPPFISENIDQEAQRKAIYDSLSASMKGYIEKLKEQARQATEQRWRNDREAIQQSMDQLRERSRQIEESASEVKQQQLSSERRKRALDVKIQELEAKISAYEAEREQYELENKSLVNKLRSASVQEQDIEALNQEIASLKAENERLKSDVPQTTATSLTDDEGNSTQLEQLNSQIDSLNSQIEQLKGDKAQLLDDVALLKKRCEIADTMINDLNHRASTAQASLNERVSEVATLTAEINQLKETATVATDSQDQALNEVESLSNQIEDLQDQLEASQNDAAKANDNLINLTDQLSDATQQLQHANEELSEARDTINLFEEALTQFEEIKENKNKSLASLKTKVEELTAANKELEETIAGLTRENEKLAAETLSLKETIHTNLARQAESEAALRGEIDKLRVSNTYGGRSKRARQQATRQEKPLDSSLDNTNWLISSPPAGENSRPTSVSDSEFGYQEPKRKDPPGNNSSQMLLW